MIVDCRGTGTAMPRSFHLIYLKYAVYLNTNLNSVCCTSIYSRGHGNAMPLPFVAFFFQINLIIYDVETEEIILWQT